MDALFVYGTLMSNERRSGLLAGLPRTLGRVRGVLYHLPAGYPALTLGGPEEIVGELVEGVPVGRWPILDLYEGVADGLYQRQEVDVRVGLGLRPAWAYVMDHPERRGGRRLPPGRWRSLGGSGWTRSTNS
jgi:gamma-glutamylcyclotransferase (GGCT)/AIG2-like uncharacterized protein YtfP